MLALKSSTCSRSGPSTITRASGSVPEKRTRTRPVPPNAASHSRTSLATEGRNATTRKILKRSLVLFILGVLTYEGIGGGIQHIRILGVLQRLALCYCGAGLAFVTA